jgi:hypothetical protein
LHADSSAAQIATAAPAMDARNAGRRASLHTTNNAPTPSNR